MQVFAVGSLRYSTGHTGGRGTLLVGIEQLGFQLIAADFYVVCDGICAAITDHAEATIAPELVAAYPEVEVIVNIRQDVDTVQ